MKLWFKIQALISDILTVFLGKQNLENKNLFVHYLDYTLHKTLYNLVLKILWNFSIFDLLSKF